MGPCPLGTSVGNQLGQILLVGVEAPRGFARPVPKLTLESWVKCKQGGAWGGAVDQPGK